MKRIVYMLLAILAVQACGGNSNRKGTAPAGEDMVEYGKTGYADIVSFIVQGYQCHWDSMNPEELGLSPVYSYSSRYAGFVHKDIDGDGIPELLLGDQFPDGSYAIYDIYTINPSDGSLIHLAKGGERDTFVMNGDGVIVETGSNSAFESITKGFRISAGKLEEVQAWDESLMNIELEFFIDYAGDMDDETTLN